MLPKLNHDFVQLWFYNKVLQLAYKQAAITKFLITVLILKL